VEAWNFRLLRLGNDGVLDSDLASAAGTLTLGGDTTVCRIGFGAMRLTNPGPGSTPPDPATAHALLRRVLKLGVNFIDTADTYGAGASERLIADALHPYPEGLVLATKGGMLPDGGLDGSPAHLRSACEASLERLRVETIDLYQLHAVDKQVPLVESLGALAELRAEGKVKHIGLSNVFPNNLPAARATVPVVSMQNRYSLEDRSTESVLETCELEELAFLPWHPLADGALARREGPLGEIATAHRATPAQVAIAWLLHRSSITLPIPGTGSIQHLEENVRAATLRLDDDQMRALGAPA
jgi:pyridoxine 4-dehydrogenase